MDRKNLIIGLICIIAGFGLMFYQGQQLYPLVEQREAAEQASALAAPSMDEAQNRVEAFAPTSSPTVTTIGDASTPSLVQAVTSTHEHVASVAETEEVIHILENEFIRIQFTNLGGAIKDIALKKYPFEIDSALPYIFNAEVHNPALAISLSNGSVPQDFAPEYELIDFTDTRIRFKHTTSEGLQIIRGYQIAQNSNGQDPYVIAHETRFINRTQNVFDLNRIFVNVGSFPETEGDSMGEYLNFGYYNGKKANYVKIGEFHESKGFFGIGGHEAKDYVIEEKRPVMWASVKNQFFASVLTPREPGVGYFVKPVDVGCGAYAAEGISGSLLLDLGSLKAGDDKLLDMEFYVGPKEYQRLEALGKDQDEIMQFGFFGFISKLLLTMMGAVHSFIPNWGLTIIAVTAIIKMLLWPLTTAQVRSSKRMSAIQEPLKALKEKYKKNPQKLQSETMKLFKENKVNPAAGCLPLLVQMPIFLGLYFMLRTASELRFAPFLWIPDLSLPDTIAVVSGFPINILPLIMGVSMYFQMKMMPSPSMDNAQKKVMQMMPFIFLFFCYSFPSGLVLYWTVQNILTIAQQKFTRNTAAVVPVEAPSKAKKSKKK